MTRRLLDGAKFREWDRQMFGSLDTQSDPVKLSVKLPMVGVDSQFDPVTQRVERINLRPLRDATR